MIEALNQLAIFNRRFLSANQTLRQRTPNGNAPAERQKRGCGA
jgi:hypothetical protein